MPDQMESSARALWRVGTKALIGELQRRATDEAHVQRAFLSECKLSLLITELIRRGYAVSPPPDAIPFEGEPIPFYVSGGRLRPLPREGGDE